MSPIFSFWDVVSSVYLLSNQEIPDLGVACWVHSRIDGERIASFHYLGSVFWKSDVVNVRGRVFNEKSGQFVQADEVLSLEDFLGKVASAPVVQLLENEGVLEDFVGSGFVGFNGSLIIGAEVGGEIINYGKFPVGLKMDGVVYGSRVVLSMDLVVSGFFGVSKGEVCARCVGGLGKARGWFDKKLGEELAKARKVVVFLEASRRGVLPTPEVTKELFLEPTKNMRQC